MKPRLIHPVDVKIFRRGETERDPDLGVTAVGFREPVTLKGQVAWTKYEALTPAGAGDRPQTDGHIVFYAGEWEKTGAGKGDEMEIENSGRLVIVEVTPRAHYGGVNHHVHVAFTRRRGT